MEFSKLLGKGLIACIAMVGWERGLAAELSLVEEGKPVARILVGKDAADAEKFAASELQRVIQLMSGASLEISSTPVAGTPALIIGTPDTVSSIASADLFETGAAEETRVLRNGSDIYLAGPTAPVALRATYTFLQDVLGARWFWPGEGGEYLTRKSTIRIDELNLAHTPSIRVRSLSINSPHYDEDTATWMARNRMNLHNVQTKIDYRKLVERGLKIMIGGHNLVLPKEMLEKHPEYLAEFGGKRQFTGDRHPPHLCWSNKRVQDEVVAMISGWWRDRPEVDSISFFGADHNHFCECSACITMAPDTSSRWQIFSSEIIRRLNAEFPGKTYQTLAYQEYRPVPTQVAPYDLIGYTTYNIDFTKPFPHPNNEKARKEIRSWQDVGGRVGLRGYQFIPFSEPMYSPFGSVIAEEIRWAHTNGLEGWTSEITPFNWPKDAPSKDWIANRLPIYLAARMTWDVNADPLAIIADWHKTVFGPAAESMTSYYWLMDRAWTSGKNKLTYFLNPPSSFVAEFISDDLLDQADRFLTEARKVGSVVGEPELRAKIISQIDLEESMLDEWRQLHRRRLGRADRYITEVPQVSDAGWEKAARLPAFEEVSGMPANLRTDGWMNWSESHLHLKFSLHGKQQPGVGGGKTDSAADLKQGEWLKIFLADPADRSRHFLLAVNPQGKRYAAVVDASGRHDQNWNPEWISTCRATESGWMVEVSLPFKECFGTVGSVGKKWLAAFKRTNDGPNSYISGWPDTSYDRRSGFGKLELVKDLSPRRHVLLYEGDQKSEVLKSALVGEGFSISTAADQSGLTSALTSKVDVLVVKRGGKFSLDDPTMAGPVRSFLEKGGCVIFAGYGGIPLERWFGPHAAIKWAGWEIDSKRNTVFSQPGSWQNNPYPLEKIIKGGISASSGYTQPADHWQVLATLRMKDEREVAYLLRQKVGKGTLVVTSSGLGYSGGGEMFGTAHPLRAAQLIGNLLHEHRQ